MARPSECTPEIVERICENLRNGIPLAEMCRENTMPHPSTVRDWMDADEDVHRAIARARADGIDVIAADVLRIADDSSGDYTEDAEGNLHLNSENIQRSKLRAEMRLKLLAKWDPKRYGDLLNSTTVNVGVAVNNVSALPEERRTELLSKKREAIDRRVKPKALNGSNGHLNGNGKHHVN